jgi:pseudouridine-5'-phosphate glycosidase
MYMAAIVIINCVHIGLTLVQLFLEKITSTDKNIMKISTREREFLISKEKNSVHVRNKGVLVQRKTNLKKHLNISVKNYCEL